MKVIVQIPCYNEESTLPLVMRDMPRSIPGVDVLGSWVVRQASGTPVPDAPSGFRAMSREAALRFNVITKYTYTLETIVQAGKKNIKVASIPVTTNKVTRPSRLVRGIFDYIKKS